VTRINYNLLVTLALSVSFTRNSLPRHTVRDPFSRLRSRECWCAYHKTYRYHDARMGDWGCRTTRWCRQQKLTSLPQLASEPRRRLMQAAQARQRRLVQA
jgi:hypothetical protein